MINLEFDLSKVTTKKDNTTPSQTMKAFDKSFEFVTDESTDTTYVKIGTELPKLDMDVTGGSKGIIEGTMNINNVPKIITLEVIQWDTKKSRFNSLVEGGVSYSKEYAEGEVECDADINCLYIPATFTGVTLKGRVREGDKPRTALITECKMGQYHVKLWIKDAKAVNSSDKEGNKEVTKPATTKAKVLSL